MPISSTMYYEGSILGCISCTTNDLSITSLGLQSFTLAPMRFNSIMLWATGPPFLRLVGSQYSALQRTTNMYIVIFADILPLIMLLHLPLYGYSQDKPISPGSKYPHRLHNQTLRPKTALLNFLVIAHAGVLFHFRDNPADQAQVHFKPIRHPLGLAGIDGALYAGHSFHIALPLQQLKESRTRPSTL